MSLDRRTVLTGAAGCLLLGTLGARRSAARDATGPAFLSCGAERDGRYFVAGLGGNGRLGFRQALPARGHGVAIHPSRAQGVVFARRPGSFALVLDTLAGTVLHGIEAAPGRHFYGHGIFAAEGRLLFAGENDYAAGRGVLGVYDAGEAYRRIGEVPSHGVGPHDLRLMPDGRTLVVANGGIRTHPDYGRAKLNLASMAPNLTYLEAASGRLLEAVRLPQALHQLSIRHLDVTAEGRVAIAMQYEGDRRDRVPLLGLHERGGEIRLLEAPAPIARRMRHYTGSVAFDASGAFLAVSSPRGHVVTLWDARRGAYLGHIEARDASGLAPSGKAGAFLVTGGDGSIQEADARDGTARPVARADGRVRWDNHLCRAG